MLGFEPFLKALANIAKGASGDIHARDNFHSGKISLDQV